MNNYELQAFYSCKEWKKLRFRLVNSAIKHNRKCKWCNKRLIKGQKMIADHIIMLRTRPDLRLNENNIQILHHECHTKKTHFQDYNTKEPIDDDGFPKSWQ